MTLIETLALASAGLAFLSCAIIAARKSMAPGEGALVLGAFGAAFLLYSLYPVTTLGPLGFWSLHTADSWGLQVWLDLLMAVSAALFLLQPRARAAGVALLPWVALIFATGSIGLYLTIARVLLAERKHQG